MIKLIFGYIKGIGRTKFGVLDETLEELIEIAIKEALRDANLKVEDIDIIFISNFLYGIIANQLHLNTLLNNSVNFVGKPIFRTESACASGGSAFFQGLLSLKRYENALIVGVEKMTDIDIKLITKALASAGKIDLYFQEGFIFPAAFALIAQQHMIKYGTTREDLELVALKNHENARLNSFAHFFNKQVSIEDIRNSQDICTPLKLYDCSPISDGAVAIIITRKKSSSRDIEVIGSSFCTDYISFIDRNDFTSFTSVQRAAAEAYKQANINPEVLDLIEVHDCFTISELIALEDLKICIPGNSKGLIRSGAINRNGRIPVNTDGGLKGNGHPVGATGLAQIFEIVTQLRGEAGERQIDTPKLALTHNIGGFGSSAAIHIFKGNK